MKDFRFLPKHDRDNHNNKHLAAHSLGQLVVSIIGFSLSVFAAFLHIKLKFGEGGPLVCDVNETINCSKIIGSEFGELFGISLGAYGMAFFGIAAGMSLLPIITQVSKAYVSLWRFFVASVGMLVALIAAFFSYFIIKGVCEVCSSIQLVCLIYFILVVREYLNSRGQLVFAENKTFLKIAMMTSLLFFVPLLLAASGSYYYQTFYRTNSDEVMRLLAMVSEGAARYSKGKNGAPEDYRKGNDNAPVVLVEFTDFECPFCYRLHLLLGEIQQKIGEDNLLVVFRNWPLSYHSHAKDLAIAARCAGRQGRFWEMADWIFYTSDKYSSNREMKDRTFSLSGLADQAVRIGVSDRKALETCIESHQEEERINDDIKEAKSLGGTGTPFVLVNGVPYKGNWLEKGVLESDLKNMIARLKSKSQ
jgi:protein-disulfide isomerase/uncharacterized membrane protein